MLNLSGSHKVLSNLYYVVGAKGYGEVGGLALNFTVKSIYIEEFVGGFPP